MAPSEITAMEGTRWTINGGNISESVTAFARSRRAGALLAVEINQPSAVVDDGSERARIGALLQRAWEIIISLLPDDTVGCRTGWSRFDFLVEGDRNAAGTLGRRLLRALHEQRELSSWTWRIIFIEVHREEPIRTLMCDPSYDLLTAKGNTIAWVEPYSNPDWREPQRYPTVTFLPIEKEERGA
jgi:hypothetical protein